MTYYASQHGPGTANTEAAIRSLKPFKSGGALSARSGNMGQTGLLNTAETNLYGIDANSIDYVVYSYATPIAWHTPNGWHVVEQKFSQSTTRHQSLVSWAVR